MRIILFDLPQDRIKLFPLTLTRPISYLRIGILTIMEKWISRFPNATIEIDTVDYLRPKFGNSSWTQDCLGIHGGLLPTSSLLTAIKAIENGQALYKENRLLAFRGENLALASTLKKINFVGEISFIERPCDIFRLNGQEIRSDFELLTNGRISQKITDPHTKTYGQDIFLEEGAKVKAAVLNAENGPIYVGKNAEVSEGAVIRGPFALCEDSVVNMGAKMRGDITIGPYCKVGGEVSNSVIMAYSNKGHDGYLGNSVIGEWCNLGAGTSNSNLKNNYANVKMWDYKEEHFRDTGLQFCGLIMGDHSKCGIHTMFNTGTSVGVSANVFGSGFPRTMIPSFSWGGSEGFETYRIDKAIETAELVMGRRNLSLTDEDKDILTHIFENFSSQPKT